MAPKFLHFGAQLNWMFQMVRWLMLIVRRVGDVLKDPDIEVVRADAEKEIWTYSAPDYKEVTDLMYENSCKIYDEMLDSHRTLQKHSDPLVVFGGVATGWLITHITKVETRAAWFFAIAAICCFLIALATSLYGRRSVCRPSFVGLANQLEKLSSSNEAQAKHWISLNLHADRQGFLLLAKYFDNCYRVTVGFIVAGLAFAFLMAITS